MQTGTVKSITFSNLYGSANIDMDNPTAWTGHSDYKAFTFAPEGGVQVTGTEDQEIMAGANTMLMLPQAMQPETSLDPTMLTVVFIDGTGSQDRELTAELSGEWQMGKPILINCQSHQNTSLNLLRIIRQRCKANELKEGWTITSNQPWATLKSQLTPFEQQGYWLDTSDAYTAYCNSLTPKVPVERTLEITGNEQWEFLLYLFMSENSGDAERQVTLSIRPSDQTNATPSTIMITQKCPNWNNNLGWDR